MSGKPIQSFVNWVQDTYRPIVMTLASADVERLCRKNHVSFTELLRPLGHELQGVGSISFRTAKSYNLKNFGVRFVSAAEVVSLDPKIADKHLDSVVRGASPTPQRMEDGVQSVEDVPGFWRTTADATPWFSRYRQQFFETLRFSEYEFVDQPVACLFAVSASEENPIAAMESMRQPRHYPPLLQSGSYDRDMLHKMYVVVHDNHNPNPNALDHAGKVLRELRKLYGENNCKLIQINSLSPTAPDLTQKDIWLPHINPSRGILALLQPDVKAESPKPGAAAAAAKDAKANGTPTSPVAASAAATTPVAASAAGGGAAAAAAAAALVKPAEVRGCFLSKPDLDRLSSLLGDLILKGILPHLERKIAALQERIALARKGFRNQLKLMFGKRETKLKTTSGGGGGAAGGNAAAAAAGQTYELSSVEAQIRTLADLCFVLQDYDGALANYKLVAADNKEDKAWRCYAGAQEMMALCVALTTDTVLPLGGAGGGAANAAALHQQQQQMRELIAHFDAAYQSFMSIGDIPRATRVTLRAVEILRYHPSHVRDCCTYLLRASEKEPGLRGALLLEQAAYTFLLLKPNALVRKYSFHLVMAGHLYHKANHKLHGVRCYQSACSVYADRGWFHVEDHIHFNLGRDCFNLSSYQQSVQYFVRLLAKQGPGLDIRTATTDRNALAAKAQETVERQRTFLQEFVYVVKKWCGGKPREVPNLKLPVFLDHSVQVILNDSQTIPSSLTVPSWDAALTMKPPMSLSPNDCNRPLFNADDKQADSADSLQRTCVVREPITVRVSMVNKLQIEITVNRLQLRCVHEPAPGVLPPTNTTATDSPTAAAADPSDPSGALTIDSQTVVLAPLATRQVELKVVCSREGTLRIDGVSWDVCDVIVGVHRFALADRMYVVKKGRRRMERVARNTTLTVPITPPLPLLSFEFVHFPAAMYHGEVAYGALRLVNFGQIALDRLAVKISHPAFIAIPKQPLAPGAAGAAGALAAAPASASALAVSTCYDYDWKTGVVDLGLQLEPGESVLLPLWVRAAVVGDQTIGFLFRYQARAGAAGAAKGGSASAFRVAHLQRSLQVTPLFNAKLFNRPSFAKLQESVLGIEIERVSMSSSDGATAAPVEPAVAITNVGVWSRSWQIAPLTASVAPPAPAPALLPSYVSPSLPLRPSLAASNSSAGSRDATPSAVAAAAAAAALAMATLSPNESTTLYVRASTLRPPALRAGAQPTLALDPWPLNPLKPLWKEPLLQLSHHATPAFTEVQFANMTTEVALPPAVAPAEGVASAVSSAEVKLRAESAPFRDLLGMEKDLLVENEHHRVQMNPAAVVARVNASDRLDVCIGWCTTDRKRFGYHFLPGQACMKTPASACSLKVALHYPRSVVHDFTASSSGGSGSSSAGVTVPVVIRIRNVLDDRAVDFLFETLPPEEEFDSTKRAFRPVHSTALTPNAGRYLWRGCTRQWVRGLPPGHTTTLQLDAVFYHSGAYNLNRFRFTVETHATTGAPYGVAPPAASTAAAATASASAPAAAAPVAGSLAAAAGAAGARAAAAAGAGPQPATKRVFFFPLQHLITVQQRQSVAQRPKQQLLTPLLAAAPAPEVKADAMSLPATAAVAPIAAAASVDDWLPSLSAADSPAAATAATERPAALASPAPNAQAQRADPVTPTAAATDVGMSVLLATPAPADALAPGAGAGVGASASATSESLLEDLAAAPGLAAASVSLQPTAAAADTKSADQQPHTPTPPAAAGSSAVALDDAVEPVTPPAAAARHGGANARAASVDLSGSVVSLSGVPSHPAPSPSPPPTDAAAAASVSGRRALSGASGSGSVDLTDPSPSATPPVAFPPIAEESAPAGAAAAATTADGDDDRAAVALALAAMGVEPSTLPDFVPASAAAATAGDANDPVPDSPTTPTAKSSDA